MRCTLTDAHLLDRAGFFLDSYDLFIINLVSPVWQYQYWHNSYPTVLRGLVNAGANIGNVFGQLAFGLLGDAFGRKFVYGKELIICIIGMVLVIALPNSVPTPTLKMIWIFCWRILMGRFQSVSLNKQPNLTLLFRIRDRYRR
jgi:PHS family inorganic phosphate transporter-like MFS transporter